MSIPNVPEGEVEIPETTLEEQVDLPVDDTVVVVVDMQNDFVKPEGNLVVPDAKPTISVIQRLLKRARAQGVHVAYTQDTQVEDDPEFDIWPEHCIEGTWGWEIIEELTPEPDDLICPKNRYDAFYDSWLDHFLSHIWEVEHLVIVGTVANICVLHTAASAGLRWIDIVVPANGISALTAFDQALTLRQVTNLYQGRAVREADDINFKGG
jgi:nicotinamidase-related amidase